MFTSLPISPPMSWSSATAKQMILWNGATCRSSGSWRGANVCVKSPRSQAIVPTGSGLLLGATISMAQRSLLISVSTTKVHHPCLQASTSSSYSESLSKLPLMAACGLAQRSESRMGGQTGRTIHPQRGWEYLKRLGLSLQMPRPRHHKADPAQQELFKRELPEQIRQIQHAHPHAQVELWAMDEHRVGLKPVIRRVWARKGHRPLIRVQQRYEWLYVYGFLHPETGASQWLLLPSVNIEVFSLALAHFAQAVKAGPDRHVVLVLDRAGWHKSGEVLMPEGIHLLLLPPYSPELQRGSTSLAAHKRSHRLSSLRVA